MVVHTHEWKPTCALAFYQKYEEREKHPPMTNVYAILISQSYTQEVAASLD